MLGREIGKPQKGSLHLSARGGKGMCLAGVSHLACTAARGRMKAATKHRSEDRQHHDCHGIGSAAIFRRM